MPQPFDLICIGTGPASSTVAHLCVKQGLRVAVVEAREFGGTCALRGCNPKKVFTNAATLLDPFRRGLGELTRGEQVRIEWADLIAFAQTFTDPVRERTEAKLRQRDMATFHGLAQFESERVIRAGETRLEAAKIFLGVGAHPTPLNIPGAEFAITSDDLFELGALPADVLFLGGGFIAFEFAHVMARAGAKVTIVDRNEPLDTFDPDLVRMLVRSSQEAGIEVLTHAEAARIEQHNGRYAVTLNTAQGVQRLTTDFVVNSGGRGPDIAGLDLTAGRIAHSQRGIKVNHYLQSTTNGAVYAAGDCADVGLPKLTPTANAAARVAAANIIASKNEEQLDVGPVPQVVFSVPALAAVGMSEAEARRAGFDLDVRFEDLSTKGEVRKLAAAAAGCKLVIDRATDKILGAHLLGPHAEEVINFFALAIRLELTAAKLKATLLAYPTMTAEYCRLL